METYAFAELERLAEGVIVHIEHRVLRRERGDRQPRPVAHQRQILARFVWEGPIAALEAGVADDAALRLLRAVADDLGHQVHGVLVAGRAVARLEGVVWSRHLLVSQRQLMRASSQIQTGHAGAHSTSGSRGRRRRPASPTSCHRRPAPTQPTDGDAGQRAGSRGVQMSRKPRS